MNKLNSKNSEKLEEGLGFSFKKRGLLREALTHRSFLNENKIVGLKSNERLEFLGDAVLSFWVSSMVFSKFPDLPEGKLTFVRTHLVRTETLTELAKELSLGKFLLMSKGEELGGGRENPVLLANSFEALIGAMFTDQGIDVVSKFLEREFSHLVEEIHDIERFRDSKSLLQEKVQAKGYPSPSYQLISATGPDHQPVFTMGVYVGNQLLAKGTSHSKQEAEEIAAEKALVKNLLEILGKIK